MNPSTLRVPCQQSSITTYWYPAAFMPFEPIASAVSLITFSLTSQANLFQLFHPIGGVGASPLATRFGSLEGASVFGSVSSTSCASAGVTA
jgi:hypothetical protein